MSRAAPRLEADDSRFGVIASVAELIALHAEVAVSVGRRGVADAALPGAHPSPRRQRGMEFAEVRPYLAGDDIRTVDWRQSARRGRLFTKLFQEEHERPLHLLVDLGPSMRFGTRVAFKSVVAARAATWLAWAAVSAGDRVGGLVWSGELRCELPPRGRHHGVLKWIKALADASAAEPAQSAPQHLAQPLDRLLRTLRPGSSVAVISDFAGLDATLERQLAILSGRAELRLIHVYDMLEAAAPPPGRYRVSDGQRSLTLDLRSASAREAYAATFAARRAALEQLARRTGATLLALPTDGDLPRLLGRAPPPPNLPHKGGGTRRHDLRGQLHY